MPKFLQSADGGDVTVIRAEGGIGQLISVDATPGSGVASVTGNDNFGVTVNNTDPANPVVVGVPVESQMNVEPGGSGSSVFVFSQGAAGFVNRGNGIFVSMMVTAAGDSASDVLLVTLTDELDNPLGPTQAITGQGPCCIIGVDTRAGNPAGRAYTCTVSNQTPEATVTVADGQLGFTMYEL